MLIRANQWSPPRDSIRTKSNRLWDKQTTDSYVQQAEQKPRAIFNQPASFCCIHSSRTEARKRQTLPICKARMSPLRAILWSVLGWSSKIAAAWPESSSGSGKNAPGNTACKRALGGSASETATSLSFLRNAPHG